MLKLRKKYEGLSLPFGIVISSAILFLTSLHSFLLFHFLVEIFTVVVAFGIFVIAWSSRHYAKSSFLLIIGISYLFVGSLGLIHMITYKGMAILSVGGANLSTQIWISARYMEAISFVLAILFLRKNNHKNCVLSGVRAYWTFFSWALFFLMILLSIFFWGIFPVTYLEGDSSGMTDFKIYSEYLISALFLFSIVLLFKKRKLLDREMINLVLLSLVVKIFSELTFTIYTNVYDFFSIVGHVFLFISFLLFYKAVLEGGFRRPYQTLFFGLKKSEERYRALVEFSPDLIVVHRGGRVIFANKIARKIFGVKKENEAIGAELVDFIHPQYREKVKERISRIVSGEWEESPPMEMEILLPEGKTLPVEAKGRRIVYEGRAAVQSIIRDISRRKLVEEKLVQAQSELRKKAEQQLVESYEYLGLVNRKISMLLELENNSQNRKTKQEIIDYILNSSRSLSRAKAAFLYLAVGKDQFNLVSSSGLEKEAVGRFQSVNGERAKFVSQLAQEKKRVSGACDLVDFGCFSVGLGFKYFVALPILADEVCRGFLFLGFVDQKSLDTQDLEFLDVFVKHVSSALVSSGIVK